MRNIPLQDYSVVRSYKPDLIDPALIEQACGDAIAGASSSARLRALQEGKHFLP